LVLVPYKTYQKNGNSEKIAVTPSHHRVHHATIEDILIKTIGQSLFFWDRWFGTPKELDAVPPFMESQDPQKLGTP
jgi:sterol desaturase/sphingolipid hydroxylase (fatty acid hydroxylase superfamily)